MARTLGQVRILLAKLGDVPFIVAGDVFDRWNPPPELINFAIRELPKCYAIPGQHDLPNHRLEDIKRSAYWTLVECGKIKNIDYTKRVHPNDVHIHIAGAPWGTEIQKCPETKYKGTIDLAVVHAYIWKRRHGYPGAPDDKLVSGYATQLKGYDAAVFGDNHRGFLAKVSGCNVLNAGTLMCRRADEYHYSPAVGILYDDGVIGQWFLDTTEDKWVDGIAEQAKQEAEAQPTGLLDDLEIGDELDYRTAVEETIARDEVKEPVADVLRRSIE